MLPNNMLAMPKTPKRRGEWAELQFMARAASYDLKLCRPWGESSRYDVTVEHATGFHRVQVKATSHSQRHMWRCCLPRQAYTAGDFDYLAVYIIPEDMWYILPFAAIGGRTSIALHGLRRAKGKYQQYIEAWHLLGKSPYPAHTAGVLDSKCDEGGAAT